MNANLFYIGEQHLKIAKHVFNLFNVEMFFVCVIRVNTLWDLETRNCSGFQSLFYFEQKNSDMQPLRGGSRQDP